MKITIKINGENDAFYDEEGNILPYEFKRIILNAAHIVWASLMENPVDVKLFDANGNACGEIKFTK